MVLFILSDFVNSGGGSGAFGREEAIIGEIRGNEISQIDFEQIVEQEINQRYGPEGAPAEAKESIRERVWQEMLQKNILFEEYEKLGLAVSAQELLDEVKNTQPGSVLYQYFTDPQTGQIYEQFRDQRTGGLNSQMVLSAIQNLLDSENSREWIQIEKAIKQDRFYKKYSTLISKGLGATSTEAVAQAKERSEKRNFAYTVKEYMSIPDEEIEITDSDLSSYYSEHQNEKRFQQDKEMRSVEYIEFIVEPSDNDLEKLREEMLSLKEEFMADSNDTAFVAERSDTPAEQAIITLKEEQMLPELKDTMPNAAVGYVHGPYQSGGSFKISKLSAVKYAPDSVRARHILLQVQPGDTVKLDSAQAVIDSLKSAIRKGADFAELAKQYSEDLGSGAKGGDLDWFGRGRMVPPFEKACFEGNVGDMPIVESQFGVHLIEITDQTEDVKQYVISNVDRVIEPSKETTDKRYREASAFAIENDTPEKFKENAGQLQIRNSGPFSLDDDNVGGLMDVREIVRWAFDAEKGDISEPFELENKFVVVHLSNIRPEGTLPLEAVKNEIESEVLREKKAEKIMSQLGDYASVQDAANALGTEVIQASDSYFNSASLPGGLGREMKVLGTAFAMQQGAVSKPIQGNRGVFVISVTNIEDAGGEPQLEDEKRTLTEELRSKTQRTLYQALQENSDVVDNRGRYY